MSRGHGSIERAVLLAVQHDDAAATVNDGRYGTAFDGSGAAGITLEALVRMVMGDSPRRAQVESVRRAVRSLARCGKVEIRRGADFSLPSCSPCAQKRRFVARPPTRKELARRAKAAREAEAFMKATGEILKGLAPLARIPRVPREVLAGHMKRGTEWESRGRAR